MSLRSLSLLSIYCSSDIVILAVYVDDILLTGSDSTGLLETKKYLKHHFVTKDKGRPKYFLGIEVAHQKYSVLLSERKYALDLLEETRLLGCKPASTTMEASADLCFDDSHALDDSGRYRRLIGKLIYFTVTRSNITFTVDVLNRFMHQRKEVHWSATLKILAYIKGCPRKNLVYRKYGYVRISRYSDSGYAVTEETKRLYWILYLCWRKPCDLE